MKECRDGVVNHQSIIRRFGEDNKNPTRSIFPLCPGPMSESFASNNFPTKLFHNEQRWHERESGNERTGRGLESELVIVPARPSIRPSVESTFTARTASNGHGDWRLSKQSGRDHKRYCMEWVYRSNGRSKLLRDME